MNEQKAKDLQKFTSQIVASNLAVAYYEHLKSGISKEQCFAEVIETWLELLELFEKYQESQKA